MLSLWCCSFREYYAYCRCSFLALDWKKRNLIKNVKGFQGSVRTQRKERHHNNKHAIWTVWKDLCPMGIIDVLLITCFYTFFSFPKIRRQKEKGFWNQNISLTGQLSTLHEPQDVELRPTEFSGWEFSCLMCFLIFRNPAAQGQRLTHFWEPVWECISSR